MKVGIVGAGFVGAAAANALVLRGIPTEIVLVDVDERRAAAEAADIAHVTTFAAPVRVRAGTTADLAGSTVVVMTAGSAQTQGQSRLDLLARNARSWDRSSPRCSVTLPTRCCWSRPTRST